MQKFFLLLIISVTVGCSAVSNEAVFKDVQTNIQQHINADVLLIDSKKTEEEISDRVSKLLKNKLTPETAVQITLLNNRALQATFEELGIARADVLEATLIPNPLLSVGARFPSGGGRAKLEFGLTENFISFLYLPLKKSIAENMLESVKAHVGHEVLALASQTQETFYDLQAAQQEHELLHSAQQAHEASWIASTKIHEAGNNTALELQNDRVLYEQAKLETARSEINIKQLREKMNYLMGLSLEDSGWTINARLSDVPTSESDLSDIEAIALSNRLDLLSIKSEIETTAKMLGIIVPVSAFSEASIGLDAERESSGDWLTGPNISFPVPLFNTGQGLRASAQARYRAAVFRYHDLAIKIKSDARAARDNLMSQRQQVELLRNVILPLRHSILSETEKSYNGMLSGVFNLLTAKQGEIEAGKQYIAALKDYWKARSQLERAIGCALKAKARGNKS